MNLDRPDLPDLLDRSDLLARLAPWDPSVRSVRSVHSARSVSPELSRRWEQLTLPACLKAYSGLSDRSSVDPHGGQGSPSRRCRGFQHLSDVLRSHLKGSHLAAQQTFPSFSDRPKTRPGANGRNFQTRAAKESNASWNFCLDSSSEREPGERPLNDSAKLSAHSFKRSSQLSRPGMLNSRERGG